MLPLKRILLIAPSEMTRTPAFDRAQALAIATGALLHIVAFDYVASLEGGPACLTMTRWPGQGRLPAGPSPLVGAASALSTACGAGGQL